MTEALIAWLREIEGPLAYVVIAVASLIEYVFPPFPGDAVALFAVAGTGAAGYDPWGVFAALNVGSIGGGLLAYGAGVVARRRRPRFLDRPSAKKTLDRIEALYAKHGAWVVAVNRFVPGLRGFFFVAAGLFDMPMLAVATLGALSAIVWNALLFGLGHLAGQNITQLTTWLERYGIVALIVLSLAIGIWWWRGHRKPASTESANEPSTTDPSSRDSAPPA